MADHMSDSFAGHLMWAFAASWGNQSLGTWIGISQTRDTVLGVLPVVRNSVHRRVKMRMRLGVYKSPEVGDLLLGRAANNSPSCHPWQRHGIFIMDSAWLNATWCSICFVFCVCRGEKRERDGKLPVQHTNIHWSRERRGVRVKFRHSLTFCTS